MLKSWWLLCDTGNVSQSKSFQIFYGLLTVHLSKIIVINRLYAQNLVL
jgi:hypothetical protein